MFQRSQKFFPGVGLFFFAEILRLLFDRNSNFSSRLFFWRLFKAFEAFFKKNLGSFHGAWKMMPAVQPCLSPPLVLSIRMNHCAKPSGLLSQDFVVNPSPMWCRVCIPGCAFAYLPGGYNCSKQLALGIFICGNFTFFVILCKIKKSRVQRLVIFLFEIHLRCMTVIHSLFSFFSFFSFFPLFFLFVLFWPLFSLAFPAIYRQVTHCIFTFLWHSWHWLLEAQIKV